MTTLDLPGLATSYRAVPVTHGENDDRLLTQSRAATGRRAPMSITFSSDVPRGERRILEYIVEALDYLRGLPDNWDGDGADPVTDTACLAAVEFLAAIVDSDTVPPYVVPLATGGVQLEWLIAAHDLEVEFGPDGEAHVLASDADGKITVDSPVSGIIGAANHDEVRDRLRRLALPLTDVG